MNIAETAKEYVDRGWHVFPIKNGTKAPACAGGFKDATIRDELIYIWWTVEAQKNHGIAIATGLRSGIFVLDVDHKPDRTIEEAIKELGFDDWPETPTIQTGGGGVQFIFAYPQDEDLRNTAGKLGYGIDTRGEGGYIVAPPTIHPSGRKYAWFDFEDEKPAQIPHWLLEKIKNAKASFLQDVDAGGIIKSGRHEYLVTVAGRMRSSGLEEPEIRAALSTIIDTRFDLSDGRKFDRDEIDRIVNWIGHKEQGDSIKRETEGRGIAEDLLEQYIEDITSLVEPEEGLEFPNPGSFPKHLYPQYGMLKIMVDWMTENAVRPQPLFCLAASIVAIGALVGRKIESPIGARTNIYAIGIGGTGSGKDWPRHRIKSLFKEIGAEMLIGPERWRSGAGLLKSLVGNPVQLYMPDEIGRVMKSITATDAQAHQADIVNALLELKTSAGSIMNGGAYSDQSKNFLLEYPCACIYGCAEPIGFFDALNYATLTNGFLPRCLVFRTDDDRPPINYDAVRTPAPKALIDLARDWWRWVPHGDISVVSGECLVVNKTAEAAERFKQAHDVADRELDRVPGHPCSTLWTRALENADQLALIHAVSRTIPGNELKVTEEDASWALAVAFYCIRSLAFNASTRIAENSTARIYNDIIEYIKQARGSGRTKNDIFARFKSVPKRHRDEILFELSSLGYVQWTEVKPKRGRPGMRYVHSNFVFASSMGDNKEMIEAVNGTIYR